MTRILHVLCGLNRGGTEAFIMNMYRNIDKSKVQFDFLILGDKNSAYIDEIKSMGGNIYFGFPLTYKGIPRFIKKCVQIMKLSKCSAVHSHINNFNSWIMYAAKLAKIKKRISHSHDTSGLGGKKAERIIHKIECKLIKRYSTDFLACSKEAGEYLYGNKVFTEKGIVVKNGIDVKSFTENHSTADDIQIPDSCSIVLGNITRFEPKKNQLFILDIFKEILNYNSNALLLLGGVDGGQLNECRQKVHQLKIEKNVQFIGVRNDINKVLRLIDVYVFPSLFEGLGIVLLEAQATNCYCVASTACPTDSDMGLGLIDYLSLEDSAKIWAKKIITGYNNAPKNIESDIIINAFNDKRYNVTYLVSQMMNIYLKQEGNK